MSEFDGVSFDSAKIQIFGTINNLDDIFGDQPSVTNDKIFQFMNNTSAADANVLKYKDLGLDIIDPTGYDKTTNLPVDDGVPNLAVKKTFFDNPNNINITLSGFNALCGNKDIVDAVVEIDDSDSD